jgi:hypothetical protein
MQFLASPHNPRQSGYNDESAPGMGSLVNGAVMRLPHTSLRYSRFVAPADKKRGRPFEPGQSGNPNGRPPGARNRSKTLALAEAVTAAELARLGRTPRQIARLLKAKPEAVKEALAQSLRLIQACAPQFAEHWLIASRVASARGDHRPAMAALQSLKVIEPIAQVYDNGQSATATAGVKVEFVNFGFAGLPPPQQQPVAIDVTPKR